MKQKKSAKLRLACNLNLLFRWICAEILFSTILYNFLFIKSLKSVPKILIDLCIFRFSFANLLKGGQSKL